MICSESSPIVYQMDGRVMADYIYLKHGMTYIFIWESEIEEKDVSDHRLSLWYEKNTPFFSIAFVAIVMLLYLISNVHLSTIAEAYEAYEECEACEKFSDENMFSTNVVVVVLFHKSVICRFSQCLLFP